MSKKSAVTHVYKFEDIDAVFVSIQKDEKSLRQKIHNAAVCIMKHWHDNPEDGSLCAQKFDALCEVSAYHAQALSVWIQNSPMKYSEENGSFYVHVDDKIMGKNFMMLRDKPFWEFKRPPQIKSVDLFDLISKDVEKVRKRAENPKEGVEDNIDRELLRDLVSSLEAAKTRRELAEANAAVN